MQPTFLDCRTLLRPDSLIVPNVNIELQESAGDRCGFRKQKPRNGADARHFPTTPFGHNATAHEY